jgi:DHA2 family methylenomycin A resistance protein-like MFS transporter
MNLPDSLERPPLEAPKATASVDRRRLALNAVCFGFFLVVLDTTALNVAIPDLHLELGGTITSLQWVLNSYTLVFASLLLTCGAVGDRIGARRFYQLGLGLFCAASLLCALAPGLGALIGLRVLQGLGAAIMLPASLSLLSHIFPDPDERARAVAHWAAVVSLAFAAGPVAGGVLTHFLGWRSIFWMNVPVSLGALAIVRAFVHEDHGAAASGKVRRIDWTGQLLVTLALFGLSYALTEAGHQGWSAPAILGSFGAAFLLVAIFMATERRSSAPVLPPALFANRTFSICVAAGLVLNFGIYGILFVESLYLQNVRHLDSLNAGLMLLPLTVLPTITTRLIVRYSACRYLKRRMLAGFAIGVSGAAVLMLSLAGGGYAAILIGLGLMGVSLGCLMPAVTTGVLASAPTSQSGVASGILNSSRQVGGTLAVALMGSLFQIRAGQGLLISFLLVLALFLLMAMIAFRFMPKPNSAP